MHGSRLRILGPIDVDPSAIVLDRPIADISASPVGGRLVVNEPRTRSGLVLAFMAVAGPTTEYLAAMIVQTADEWIRR